MAGPRSAARALMVCRAKAKDGDDDDDDEPAVAGKPLRIERLLANLGYGKRRECQQLVKKGVATTRAGARLKVGEKACWGDILLDGEELDPPSPLVVALHKPVGYVVTSPDDENIPDPVVYDLLPYRFGRRRPFLSAVGRLDKDTSGLLLLTDDGTLLHRIISPKRGIWKVYEAELAAPMTAKQADAAARKFAAGTLVLEGDFTPLLPARLQQTGERSVTVSLCEGRYHQVRRMLAAVGHEVVVLRRVSIGGMPLGSLPSSEWRYVTPEELALVFEGPTTEDVLGAAAAAAGGTGGGGAATAVRGQQKQQQASSGSRAPAAAAASPSAEPSGEATAETAAAGSATASSAPAASASGRAAPEAQRAGGRRGRDGERGGGEGRAGGTGDDGDVEEAEVWEVYEGDEDAVVSSGSGELKVRKYKDGARWQRRRNALKQIVKQGGGVPASS